MCASCLGRTPNGGRKAIRMQSECGKRINRTRISPRWGRQPHHPVDSKGKRQGPRRTGRCPHAMVDFGFGLTPVWRSAVIAAGVAHDSSIGERNCSMLKGGGPANLFGARLLSQVAIGMTDVVSVGGSPGGIRCPGLRLFAEFPAADGRAERGSLPVRRLSVRRVGCRSLNCGPRISCPGAGRRRGAGKCARVGIVSLTLIV